MPHAPRSKRLDFSTIDDVAAAIRERGGRLSSTRRLVLETLFAADAPLSAERIAERLGLELSSVYRALERLEELGVVRHVHLGHGPGLYTLVGEGEREYLVCEHCDRVTAVDSTALDEVRAQIEAAYGYQARFSHFPIVGLCPDCAARER